MVGQTRKTKDKGLSDMGYLLGICSLLVGSGLFFMFAQSHETYITIGAVLFALGATFFLVGVPIVFLLHPTGGVININFYKQIDGRRVACISVQRGEADEYYLEHNRGFTIDGSSPYASKEYIDDDEARGDLKRLRGKWGSGSLNITEYGDEGE